MAGAFVGYLPSAAGCRCLSPFSPAMIIPVVWAGTEFLPIGFAECATVAALITAIGVSFLGNLGIWSSPDPGRFLVVFQTNQLLVVAM